MKDHYTFDCAYVGQEHPVEFSYSGYYVRFNTGGHDTYLSFEDEAKLLAVLQSRASLRVEPAQPPVVPSKFSVGDVVVCNRPDFDWRTGTYRVTAVDGDGVSFDGEAGTAGRARDYDLYVKPVLPAKPAHKFKAGDQVKYVKRSGRDSHHLVIGKVYEVFTTVENPGPHVHQGGCVRGYWNIHDGYEDSFELYVEPVIETPKFAVGDWVECVEDPGGSRLKVGKLYRVTGSWGVHPTIDDGEETHAEWYGTRFKAYKHAFSDAEYDNAAYQNGEYDYYIAKAKSFA